MTDFTAEIITLLESADRSNIDLGLMILSGFPLDAVSTDRLLHYYLESEKIAKQQRARTVHFGTETLPPTKNSRLLTVLLNNAPPEVQKKIIVTHFLNGDTLRLPRLEMTTFPQTVFQLLPLRHLVWQHGKLQHLPAELLQLPHLQTIDVRHQPLESIAEVLTTHPNLKEIWISNALIVTEDLAEDAAFDIFVEAAY